MSRIEKVSIVVILAALAFILALPLIGCACKPTPPGRPSASCPGVWCPDVVGADMRTPEERRCCCGSGR